MDFKCFLRCFRQKESLPSGFSRRLFFCAGWRSFPAAVSVMNGSGCAARYNAGTVVLFLFLPP